MNIFVLDLDPVVAASYLCDKHVNKMTLECGQLLSTALSLHGIKPEGIYQPYQPSNRFPKWASLSRENFNWLVFHGLAIAEQYTARYRKVHKSQRIIEECSRFSGLLPDSPLTDFERSKGVDNTKPIVEAYRAFYKADKADFAVWSAPSVVPHWW